MARIKAGEVRFLVATDVAARGIDISDLTCVIGYATPDQPETYVHRTGRTGRAGKAGLALSLVSALDIGNFRYLQNVNRITIPERKLPTEADLQERMRERLAVKVEQEMRSVPASDRDLEDRPLRARRTEDGRERRGTPRTGGDLRGLHAGTPPADDRLRGRARAAARVPQPATRWWRRPQSQRWWWWRWTARRWWRRRPPRRAALAVPGVKLFARQVLSGGGRR